MKDYVGVRLNIIFGDEFLRAIQGNMNNLECTKFHAGGVTLTA